MRNKGGRPKTYKAMYHLQFRATREQTAKLLAFVAERRKVRVKVYSRSDALRQALKDFIESHK